MRVLKGQKEEEEIGGNHAAMLNILQSKKTKDRKVRKKGGSQESHGSMTSC